jgi:hypothetical protein
MQTHTSCTPSRGFDWRIHCSIEVTELLGPSYFFISLVLGPLNSLFFSFSRGLGRRMHLGVEVTESSTNKQHHLSLTNKQQTLSRSPSPPPPSFTQSPSPPRSLVRDGQTSPHRPRLVVSRSTCPPLSPSLHANSFIIGTAVINTHTARGLRSTFQRSYIR